MEFPIDGTTYYGKILQISGETIVQFMLVISGLNDDG